MFLRIHDHCGASVVWAKFRPSHAKGAPIYLPARTNFEVETRNARGLLGSFLPTSLRSPPRENPREQGRLALLGSRHSGKILVVHSRGYGVFGQPVEDVVPEQGVRNLVAAPALLRIWMHLVIAGGKSAPHALKDLLAAHLQPPDLGRAGRERDGQQVRLARIEVLQARSLPRLPVQAQHVLGVDDLVPLLDHVLRHVRKAVLLREPAPVQPLLQRAALAHDADPVRSGAAGHDMRRAFLDCRPPGNRLEDHGVSEGLAREADVLAAPHLAPAQPGHLIDARARHVGVESHRRAGDAGQEHARPHASGELVQRPEVARGVVQHDRRVAQHRRGDDPERLARLVLQEAVEVQRLELLDDAVQQVAQVEHRRAHSLGEELSPDGRPWRDEAQADAAQEVRHVDEGFPRQRQHIVVDLRPVVEAGLLRHHVGADEAPRTTAVHHVGRVQYAGVPQRHGHAGPHAAPHAPALEGDGHGGVVSRGASAGLAALLHPLADDFGCWVVQGVDTVAQDLQISQASAILVDFLV
eukprot:scaffold576_cov260-Pinguiococcus_pyrenoidosus.AAC.2